MNGNVNDLQPLYDIVAEGRGQPELILQRLIQTIKERPLPPSRGSVPQLVSQPATSNAMTGFKQGTDYRMGDPQNIEFSGQGGFDWRPKISPTFQWTLSPKIPPNALAINQQFSKRFMQFASPSSSPSLSLQQQQQQQQNHLLLSQQQQTYKFVNPQMEELNWLKSHPYYIVKYKANKKSRSKQRRVKRSWNDNNGGNNRTVVGNQRRKRQRVKVDCEGLEQLAQIALAELQVPPPDKQQQYCEQEISFGGQRDVIQKERSSKVPEVVEQGNHQTISFQKQQSVFQNHSDIFNFNTTSTKKTPFQNQQNKFKDFLFNTNFTQNVSNQKKDTFDNISELFMGRTTLNNQRFGQIQNNLIQQQKQSAYNCSNPDHVNDMIMNLLDFTKNTEEMRKLESKAENLQGLYSNLSVRCKNLLQKYEYLKDQMAQLDGSMETNLASLEYKLIQNNEQLMQILKEQPILQKQRKEIMEWLQNMTVGINNKQQNY